MANNQNNNNRQRFHCGRVAVASPDDEDVQLTRRHSAHVSLATRQHFHRELRPRGLIVHQKEAHRRYCRESLPFIEAQLFPPPCELPEPHSSHHNKTLPPWHMNVMRSASSRKKWLQKWEKKYDPSLSPEKSDERVEHPQGFSHQLSPIPQEHWTPRYLQHVVDIDVRHMMRSPISDTTVTWTSSSECVVEDLLVQSSGTTSDGQPRYMSLPIAARTPEQREQAKSGGLFRFLGRFNKKNENDSPSRIPVPTHPSTPTKLQKRGISSGTGSIDIRLTTRSMRPSMRAKLLINDNDNDTEARTALPQQWTSEPNTPQTKIPRPVSSPASLRAERYDHAVQTYTPTTLSRGESSTDTTTTATAGPSSAPFRPPPLTTVLSEPLDPSVRALLVQIEHDRVTIERAGGLLAAPITPHDLHAPAATAAAAPRSDSDSSSVEELRRQCSARLDRVAERAGVRERARIQAERRRVSRVREQLGTVPASPGGGLLESGGLQVPASPLASLGRQAVALRETLGLGVGVVPSSRIPLPQRNGSVLGPVVEKPGLKRASTHPVALPSVEQDGEGAKRLRKENRSVALTAAKGKWRAVEG
ncbi:hypothetical protein BS50DRAFT_590178 [Corynespora cassiicola Philippines]|uniref:Uncharacterized protein n=1 Tax=Corynespora cassiicola Philippines TaxID=1448308 RepID=A0A2T2NG42_CORCC|nr:hypothetical protein BS50DRAFT_590178 [Corynespora cassiicola Philippines]